MGLAQEAPNRSQARAGLPELLGKGLRRPAWLALLVFGRFSAARGLVRHLAGRVRPAIPTPVEGRRENLSGLDTLQVLSRLRSDGLCTGLRLPEATIAQIRDYAETHVCYGGPTWTRLLSPGIAPVPSAATAASSSPATSRTATANARPSRS